MTPRSAGTRSALLILLTFAACGHDGSGPSPAVTHLYVANDGHSNILAFALPLTAASLPAETTATDTGRKPVGIAVDGSGNVYICPESGFLSVFHQPLSAASQPADSVDLHATSCAYIAIGPDGRLYVADTGNARVQRLAPDGTPEANWPLP